MAERNHLFLVDGSGYIFRAYYALPPLYRKSDGLPTGAVNGFCNMLYKLIEDTDKKISPTHLAVIFDSARKTFRNDIYKEYKANRGDPPEDLIPQFKIIKDAVKAFGIPSIELSGYEADDIIATYASLAENKKWSVSIVSSDKDLMQIVSNQVKLIDTMKNKTIGPNEVLEKFGVGPKNVIDVQALAGDSSDNVPGAPGIGIKTAAQLINEFQSIENLLENYEEIKQQKRRETIRDSRKNILISKSIKISSAFGMFDNRKRVILDRGPSWPDYRTAEPFLIRYYPLFRHRPKWFPFNIFIHKLLKSDLGDLHDHYWSYICLLYTSPSPRDRG